MMKNRLIGLLLLLPLFSVAQQREFTVEADFGPGVENKVLFVRFTLSTGQQKDTLFTTDGKVVFKGMVNEERQIAQLIVLEGVKQRSAIFYLEPGTIHVRFPYTGEPDSRVTIGGTPLNEDYQYYFTLLDRYTGARNRPEGNTTPIKNGTLEAIRELISQRPDSPISVDLLNRLAVQFNEPVLLLEQYERLSAKIKKSEEGKELLTRIKGMGAAKIGDMAPDFTLPDTTGNLVSLSDFSGKYVLIDFWATWCAPCIAEMPNLAKAYEQYRGENFEIIGVSLDRPDSKALWLSKIKELNLSWIHLSDLKWWNNTAALLYNVNSVPASFLIDPWGKVVAVDLRGEELGKKLAEFLISHSRKDP